MATMDTTTIEQIVREVLRRLACEGDAAEPPAPCRPVSLHLEQPVVGLAALRAQLDATQSGGSAPPVSRPWSLAVRLDGIERVVVAPGAVVTPAVRDLLRDCRIPLVRGEENGSQGGPARGNGPLLVGIDIDAAATSVAAESLQRKLPIEPVRGRDLPGLIDGVAAELRAGDRRAVVLTDATAAALCLANRHAGVRAVLAATLREMQEAADAVGANLLVCSTRRTAAGEWLRMVEGFCRRGVPQCPATLRGRLG